MKIGMKSAWGKGFKIGDIVKHGKLEGRVVRLITCHDLLVQVDVLFPGWKDTRRIGIALLKKGGQSND